MKNPNNLRAWSVGFINFPLLVVLIERFPIFSCNNYSRTLEKMKSRHQQFNTRLKNRMQICNRLNFSPLHYRFLVAMVVFCLLWCVIVSCFLLPIKFSVGCFNLFCQVAPSSILFYFNSNFKYGTNSESSAESHIKGRRRKT